MNSSSEEHKRLSAESHHPIALTVITVSDTRTPENDQNYHYLASAIAEQGDRLVDYRLVPDEPAQILAALTAGIDSPAQVLIFNGGTGIAKRDCTYDLLIGRLEKKLDGFGELFRWLSYQQIGSAAMLSRAMAGICQNKVIFSLPGSPQAVQLAWEKLIAPELSHLVWLLNQTNG